MVPCHAQQEFSGRRSSGGPQRVLRQVRSVWRGEEQERIGIGKVVNAHEDVVGSGSEGDSFEKVI
jgi:hypothetical protein